MTAHIFNVDSHAQIRKTVPTVSVLITGIHQLFHDCTFQTGLHSRPTSSRSLAHIIAGACVLWGSSVEKVRSLLTKTRYTKKSPEWSLSQSQHKKTFSKKLLFSPRQSAILIGEARDRRPTRVVNSKWTCPKLLLHKIKS